MQNKTSKIYISIGTNCSPRGYIKEHYNLSKSNGYKSCPFDLCITKYDSLYDCIDTDFIDFFKHLKIIPWGYAEGTRLHYDNPTCITNKYGIIFNHEGSAHSHLFKDGKDDDEFFIRNDFEEFKKRYSKRIENFKLYLNDYKDIVFVCTHLPDDDNSKLKDLLSRKYVDKIFSFIYI